ncbi:MAG: hypothetical protein WBR15_02045 [Gammaproteobacteria bacterium]
MTLGEVVMVETVVEGEVHNPGGVTDDMGVTPEMTMSLLSENAQVVTEQLGVQEPPPPVCRYQAVAKVSLP